MLGLLGALIASREPRNSIGWLMVSSSLATSLIHLPIGYGYAALVIEHGAWPLGSQAVWFGAWSWVPVLGLSVPLIAARFPDGKLRLRWRIVDWLAISGTVLFALAIALVASALKVIELIVEQGEGLRGNIENSHYARFLAIRGELDRLRAGRVDFEPSRPVIENPFTEPPPDSDGFNLIDHPDSSQISDLFNATYGLMVELLMRFFAHTEETHEELQSLVAAAIGKMLGVIKLLGPILTSLPATTGGDAPRASFAFYRSINYLPHRDAAWALFDERFGELAEFSGRLAAGDKRGLGLDAVHDSIQSLWASLKHHRRTPVAN